MTDDNPKLIRVDQPMTEAFARSIAEAAAAESGRSVKIEYQTVDGQAANAAAHVMTWPFPGLVIPDPEPPWTRWDTLGVVILLAIVGAIAAVILL